MAGILSIAVSCVCVAFAWDDCKDCAPHKLCATHQGRGGGGAQSPPRPPPSRRTSLKRKNALERIAALKDGHENAPSAAAAKALAAGLEDASWPIRIATVKLLAKGQDRDVAIDAISKSLESARKDGAKWMTFAAKSGMTADQKVFAEYLKTTSEALAAMKDDAAGHALIEFLSKAGIMPEDMVLPVVQSVGAVGTQGGVRTRDREAGAVGGFRRLAGIHHVLVHVATAHGGKGLP
jgi:hypothetical protein